MNLQRRDEEQNDEGAQEHGARGDSRESRHGGDDLRGSQFVWPMTVMRGGARTGGGRGAAVNF